MKLNETNAKFAVVKTAFHNGGTIGFYNSLDAAKKAALRYQGGSGCRCGCADVVPVTRDAQKLLTEFETPALYADLPEWYPGFPNPYALCK